MRSATGHTFHDASFPGSADLRAVVPPNVRVPLSGGDGDGDDKGSPLQYAMVRPTRGEPPMAVPASKALSFAARRLDEVLQASGPGAIAFCLAPNLADESRYVATKFARGSLRTSHVTGDSITGPQAGDGERLDRAWNLPHGTVPANVTRDLPATLDALERGKVRAAWLFGLDDVADDLRAASALARAELLIFQGCRLPASCAAADVAFPSLRPGRFISPAREARPDWWWVQQVAAAMGFRAGLQFACDAEIRDELARTLVGA